MKIIAKTSGGYLVEATDDELALAAGYYGNHDRAWRKSVGNEYQYAGPRIGTELNVRAAYNFHRRIEDNQEKARSAAGILRGLAEMLDGVMPDVLVPPAPPVAEETATQDAG